MPLLRILRAQTPALVPLFHRSIRPRSACPASRREFYNFLSRYLNPAEEATKNAPPKSPEDPPPCLASAEVPTPPPVNDAAELGVIHPPAPPPEIRRVALVGATEYAVPLATPARAKIERMPTASEVFPRPLRPVRVPSTRRTEVLLRRGFIPRDPETGEPEAYYPRVRKLTVATESAPKIAMIRRAPASLFARDVRLPVSWVAGRNAEGVLLEIRWRAVGGASLKRQVYITPREVQAEWDFWEKKRADPAGYADRFSPLSGVLQCDITEEQAVQMYTSRLPDGSSVPLWNLPLEVRLVRSIANANQRMSAPVAMPRESRIYRRVIDNIRRIIGTPLSESYVTIEFSAGKMGTFPRDIAIMKTLIQAQIMIFEFEKYVGIITYDMRNASKIRRPIPLTTYRPTQTHPSEFPEFMLTKAIYTLERFEANTMLIISTPLDAPTVEFRTFSNAYHASRLEAITKTVQSFCSAIGMAQAGIKHIRDRGIDESEYILQGYGSLLDRVQKNTTILLEAPILSDFPPTQMIYSGVSTTGATSRVGMVDRILGQSARALYLADRLVRKTMGKPPTLRRVQSRIYPAQKILHMNQARAYSTMRRIGLNPETVIRINLARAHSTLRKVPTGPTRHSKFRPRAGPRHVKPPGRVRTELMAWELELERNMDGVMPNIAAQDPAPETVPDTNSADDTFGHSWESASSGGGGGDMSDFAEASGAKPLEIGDLCEVR